MRTAAALIQHHVVRCLRSCGWPSCTNQLIHDPGDPPRDQWRYCSEHKMLAFKRQRTLRSAIIAIDRELETGEVSMPIVDLKRWRRQIVWEMAQHHEATEVLVP